MPAYAFGKRPAPAASTHARRLSTVRDGLGPLRDEDGRTDQIKPSKDLEMRSLVLKVLI